MDDSTISRHSGQRPASVGRLWSCVIHDITQRQHCVHYSCCCSEPITHHIQWKNLSHMQRSFHRNCEVCSRCTCSWKSSHYVGLLQWLTRRLTTECTAVQRAQEGSGATAQVVCRLVFSHGAVWQHRHIQLPVLQTVKHLQGGGGGGGAQLQPETTPPSAFWSPWKTSGRHT